MQLGPYLPQHISAFLPSWVVFQISTMSVANLNIPATSRDELARLNEIEDELVHRVGAATLICVQ